MTTFDRREEAFENKFAHDETMRFRAQARRDRMLGGWAAGKLGLNSEEAARYARDVIRTDVREGGDEDVFRKIRQDFDAAGVGQSDHQIRRTMDEFMAEAIAQLQEEG